MAKKQKESVYVPRVVETNIKKGDLVFLKSGQSGEVEKQELQCFFKLKGEKKWGREFEKLEASERS